MRNIHGKVRISTIFSSGVGSVLSLSRSMKYARLEPQARLTTDVIMAIIRVDEMEPVERVTIPFTKQAIDEISRNQSRVGKFNLGLPSCSPNISTSVILGLKPFKELLYSAQLKFYVRLSKQSNDRWSKDALRDNICGGWSSPYIKMLSQIKQEVGMLKWPVSARHVDIVLSHHFMEQTNSEIRRLKLPALVPLSKRERMSHVNESPESKVCGFDVSSTC